MNHEQYQLMLFWEAQQFTSFLRQDTQYKIQHTLIYGCVFTRTILTRQSWKSREIQ